MKRRAADTERTAIGRARRQAGEGNLGCILWGAVLVVVLHVAWVMVPVKISSAQLGDFMEDQALVAERSTPEQIQRRIVARAKQLDIPLEKKKVEVTKRNDTIFMRATYTIPVEFVGGYVYEWDFEHEVERPIFIF